MTKSAKSLSREHDPAEDAVADCDRLEGWSRRLAGILDSLDDPERLPQVFLESMASLVPAAYCYAAVYPSKRLASYPPDVERPASPILPYIEQFADQPAGEGCFRLDSITPNDLEGSEFFRDLYLEKGFIDELDHITAVPDGGHIVVGILRSIEQGKFSDDEVALHESIHPLVALVSRRIARQAESDGDFGESTLDPGVTTALEKFGGDCLTARERDVIKLALLGSDTKSTAERLGVSRETVKLHRKHAYAKLRVGSQGELFFEFLESIRADSDETT